MTVETQPLSPDQIKMIKDSVPILGHIHVQLAEKFYRRLFKQYPEFKDYFNTTNQKLLRQPRIFIHTLVKVAENVDNFEQLEEDFQRIASKHVGLQVRPDHYPKMGEVMVNTICDLFPKEMVDDEFREAWEMTYDKMANMLINLEAEEYATKAWFGFKEFKVTRLQRECIESISFYIAPVDGKPIPKPKRGQYLCMRWQLPGAKNEISRVYSISEYPKGNEYRFTVRYIPGGQISVHIHNNLKIGDTVFVAPPCGSCYYESSPRDLVVLAGGNGITALLSMIEAGLEDGRNVRLLYSNRSPDSRSFGPMLREYKRIYQDRFHITEFISRARYLDPIDQYNNRSLTIEDLDFITPEHDVYLIGPRSYMKMVEDYLTERNIKVKLDYFGPQEI
ncbi:Flavohemoprotein [Candida viswanathii]|uniref:nitric oxide dioxygenase n=1 Tax=Candida viswanathii TaxID=5486 RepID=A0A367XUI4_9ASCO|nr:Flavohemoprotein [Candida viswanathii]